MGKKGGGSEKNNKKKKQDLESASRGHTHRFHHVVHPRLLGALPHLRHGTPVVLFGSPAGLLGAAPLQQELVVVLGVFERIDLKVI